MPFVNRTTWRIDRKTKKNPSAGSLLTQPKITQQTIGTYVASQLPASTAVMESLGVPIVAIDCWIPDFPAGCDILEGDFATDMERNVQWEVVQAYRYPTKIVVGLKTVETKSLQ